MSVDLDQIAVSYKFKHNNEVFKHFIGYQKGEIVKPLCFILPQMSGYIKYFENDSKSMSFLFKDEEVWDKYDTIWDVIKDCIACISCITIDSVMTINEKNHPQVYLEECKYRIKKIKIPNFIKTEFKSDSDSDSEKVDYELMTKLESGSE